MSAPASYMTRPDDYEYWERRGDGEAIAEAELAGLTDAERRVLDAARAYGRVVRLRDHRYDEQVDTDPNNDTAVRAA